MEATTEKYHYGAKATTLGSVQTKESVSPVHIGFRGQSTRGELGLDIVLGIWCTVQIVGRLSAKLAEICIEGGISPAKRVHPPDFRRAGF